MKYIDNEDNALNSSDKEHIGTITSQLQTQPAKSPMQDKSSIKSSTLNSKHVDILGEMRRGMILYWTLLDNNDQNYKLVSDLSKTNKKQPNK